MTDEPGDLGDLTYDGPGWTRGVLGGAEPPAGWRNLSLSVPLPGVSFQAAGEALLSWQVHRAAGVRVQTQAPRAVVGAEVTTLLGLGPLAVAAPCRVVWVEEPVKSADFGNSDDSGDLMGFAYGTRPAHPFVGEEAFAVRRHSDGRVTFEVRASSRPARWYTRLAGPIAPVFQRQYVLALARAARVGRT